MVVRVLMGVVALVVSIGVSSAAAQEGHGAGDAGAGQDAVQEHDAAPAGGPSMHIGGFMNVDYARTDDASSNRGFSLGQFVLHVSSSLGSKVSFFAETSFTATSSGAYDSAVERAILRWDYNDWLKVSAGKYHTPINYWNTAYHHGAWLQTTISRPDMIQFGGVFQPTHFVGLLAEGNLPVPAAGLGYNVGVGNGRGPTPARSGDAGDVNDSRAWTAKLYARPAALYGLEFGGATYRDTITQGGRRFGEWIHSAYVVSTRETPEVIAEFANVRHHDEDAGADYSSRALYVQAAYRFPDAPRWKPYARFEKLTTPIVEPVFGDLASSVWTAGVRFELSDFAAAKAEYRNRQHRPGDPRGNGVFFQTAFTF